MGRRRGADNPFNKVVDEIRHLMVDRVWSSSISDDMDMYYVKVAGYSPMERLEEQNARQVDQAELLVKELLEAGPSAAEAVARGMRMQGTWREKLLPYVEQHRGLPVVREALELVAKRQRDPLAGPARIVLDKARR